MRCHFLLASSLVLAIPAWADPTPAPSTAPAEKPAENPSDAAQTKADAAQAVRVIAATASAIDDCTARYTTEFPDRKGTATLKAEITEGRVARATVDTELRASDRLQVCLRNVASQWRFNPPPGPGATLSLPIPVEKGKKVIILKPGEKPRPAPAGQPEAPEPSMINLGSGFGS